MTSLFTRVCLFFFPSIHLRDYVNKPRFRLPLLSTPPSIQYTRRPRSGYSRPYRTNKEK